MELEAGGSEFMGMDDSDTQGGVFSLQPHSAALESRCEEMELDGGGQKTDL